MNLAEYINVGKVGLLTQLIRLPSVHCLVSQVAGHKLIQPRYIVQCRGEHLAGECGACLHCYAINNDGICSRSRDMQYAKVP